MQATLGLLGLLGLAWLPVFGQAMTFAEFEHQLMALPETEYRQRLDLVQAASKDSTDWAAVERFELFWHGVDAANNALERQAAGGLLQRLDSVSQAMALTDDQRFRWLVVQGEYAQLQQNNAEGCRLFEQAMGSLSTVTSPVVRAELMQRYSRCQHLFEKESHRAQLLKTAIRLAAGQSALLEAQLLVELGEFYNRLGNHTLAERYYQQGLDGFTRLDASADRLTATLNVALAQMSLGKYAQSLTTLSQGDAIFSQDYWHFQSHRVRAEIALTQQNYAQLLQISRANELYRDALLGSAFATLHDQFLTIGLLRQGELAAAQRLIEARDLTAYEGMPGKLVHYQRRLELELALAVAGELGQQQHALDALLAWYEQTEAMQKRAMEEMLNNEGDFDFQQQAIELLRQQTALQDSLRQQEHNAKQQAWLTALGFGLAVVILTAYLVLMSRSKERIQRLSERDDLTGVLNRRAILSHIQRSAQQKRSMVVCLFDLDHFKRINDSYGHVVGDAALRHVAQLVTQTLRQSDLIGRIGGEEFLLCFHESDPSFVDGLCERLRQRLAGSPLQIGERSLLITASFACVAATPEQLMSFQALYSQLDATLYQAKDQGRNRLLWVESGIA
ncbi:hypothetical protein GCM10023333_11120 [Ferrimonas pelagia]|uniref:diguanylate cyclase n=1 Tax=Ferrimonas pelagia TaxID=1177826 RepID=A0ABP9EK49_9GAMM